MFWGEDEEEADEEDEAGGLPGGFGDEKEEELVGGFRGLGGGFPSVLPDLPLSPFSSS